MFLIGQEVEERGSSFHICVGIPQDLVHRLAGAGLGGEMNDGMNILQGGAPYAAIAHVSAEYLHTSIVQKGRPLPIGESSMYLRAEIIEQTDLLSIGHEHFGDLTSDKSKTACD